MLNVNTMPYQDYVEFNLNVSYGLDNFTIPIQLLCTAPSHLPGNIEEVAAYTKQWALNLELVESGNKLLRPELAQGSASAFRNATADNLKTYTCFALLILLLDDIVDEAWQSLGDKENITHIFKLFSQALAGKDYSFNSIDAKLNFPKLNSLLLAFNDIHHKLEKNKLDKTYFLLSIQNFLSYLIKEFEYRQNYSKLSLDEYLEIRAIVGALEPSCEMVYLLQKIELSSDDRNNKDFLLFKDLAYKALIVANDILSLGKEIRQGNTSDNYILIKQAHQRCSIQSSIQEFQRLYNKMIVEMAVIKSRLINNINLSNIAAATQVIEEQIQAHLDWALQTARYHNNKLNIIRTKKIDLTPHEIRTG